MTFSLPPIVKLAERLLLDSEQTAVRFPRVHRYATGARLRDQAMLVAQLAHHAWRERDDKAAAVRKLAKAIDHLKITLQLGSGLRAFASFGQFEALARQVNELGRQVGGWLKQQHPKGQNGQARAPGQRAMTLSTRAAWEQANR